MSPVPSSKFTLLLVDDEAAIITTLKRTFLDTDYCLVSANSGAEALSLMAKTKVHAALIDLKMPGMDGLELLEIINTQYPHVMTILLTGHGNIQDAVAAIKNGAIDFIEKPFVTERLVSLVSQLSSIWQIKRENKALKNEISHRFRYEKLLGNSACMLQLKQLISRVGMSDATVLIQGETGTGKELVAKAIHHQSARAGEKFVVVDCTTINETMLESELFGHVKGSFTGAYTDTKGLVMAANKGTVFFDEIGELPLQTQAKLLRLMQEKEIRPVGSSDSVVADVRILAATNRNLKSEVINKRFREDLYYRLNAVALDVPPLSKRQDDVYLLARHFLKKHKTEFSKVQNLSDKALSHMEKYSWPGNVRELENLISRLTALGLHKEVRVEDLPDIMRVVTDYGSASMDDSLEAYEKLAIGNALEKTGHHRKNAAMVLRIGQATLYRKIKKYWPETRI